MNKALFLLFLSLFFIDPIFASFRCDVPWVASYKKNCQACRHPEHGIERWENVNTRRLTPVSGRRLEECVERTKSDYYKVEVVEKCTRQPHVEGSIYNDIKYRGKIRQYWANLGWA